MRKKILILEDSKERIAAFQINMDRYDLTIVEHSYEAIEQLKNNHFDLVMLDHDLNGKQIDFDQEDYGSVVAKWMRNNEYYTKVIIHSLNIWSQKNMASYLNYCPTCGLLFAWTKEAQPVIDKFIGEK